MVGSIHFTVIDCEENLIGQYEQEFNSVDDMFDYLQTIENSVQLNGLDFIDKYWHIGIVLA